MAPAEAVEPYAPGIVDVLMNLVKVENEENAVICMKTIMDFHRHQARVLADHVQPFLDLIQVMFDKVEDAVKETFDSPAPASGPVVPSTPSNSGTNFQSPRPASPLAAGAGAVAGAGAGAGPGAGLGADLGLEPVTTRPLQKGLQSFKVLAECPIIVVSLFHSHRNCVGKNVKEFVPRIKKVLLLQAEPQERAHAEAKKMGRVFTGVSSQIRNRAAFGDFITAQVKTMSFLAYLLRVYSQQLSDFIQALPDIVVRLLKDCPRERSSARKELLVAIRHIINFNYRKVFMRKIDELLEESVLIGDGLTVYETMRPLAYSMLADLIHHVRDSLEREQIRRTIEVYTRNLHDEFPGTSFQTMSAKLLLNMAESIARLPDKRDARHYLIMILKAIGDKFAAMNRQYPNAVKLTKRYAGRSFEAAAEDYLAERDQAPDWDETDIFQATPIKTTSPRERGADPVADNKFLFKNLMNGLKNMFYQLKLCNPEPSPVDTTHGPANWPEVSYGFDADEVEVITKLFREGAGVFRYYGPEQSSSLSASASASTSPPSSEPQNSSPIDFLSNPHMISSGKEEKDLLETFATVFHCIDPATFHEVFRSEIPRLYEMTFHHAALLHVPQFFLASETTSPSFCGMLLQFVMARLEDIGSVDSQRTSILLRLFKLCFMAVTLFSTQNEPILLPHVTTIITRSIELSGKAEEPMNYFLLLRSLFRSIGGGRFEHLYKEILPLLEMILDVLSTLLHAAKKATERDLYVELSLTVPARLSNLLPHLSRLMRPLVFALGGGPELVSQGLRTLELCVDNLTGEYLDPIMEPVMPELMAALWAHLRSSPYSHYHAHTTMRILGKLGGRNRRYLTQPPSLEFRAYADAAPSMDVGLVGSTQPRAFPATLGFNHAIMRLMEPAKGTISKECDLFYKRQAFHMISSQLKLLIGVDNLPDDFANLVRLQATDLLEAQLDAGSEAIERLDREKSVAKKDEQEQILKQLLKACIFAVSIRELRDEASKLVANVCRHLTVLEVARALMQLKRLRKPFEVASSEGPLYLDSRVLADVIVESLSSEFPEVRKTAEDVVQAVRDSAAIIFGSNSSVHRLPFFAHLAKTFAHSCHREDSWAKAGGTRGISLLITRVDLGDSWMLDRQADLVRALMYTVKDLSQDLPVSTRILAQKTLEALLRRCNASATREDLGAPASRLLTICGYLTYELANMNKHVRDTAQQMLSVIASMVGAELHDLVAPAKERLLSPIYNKPLRALPLATQIGYLDAISFAMGLGHGIVEFNEQLGRLLVESLGAADPDNEPARAKVPDLRTTQQINSLRVAAVHLLSLAMQNPEFSTIVSSEVRDHMVSAFFKSLYAKSQEVIEVANEGLKKVMALQNKLPKELLQHGLRPILMNLQDYRRLTIAGLEGLARLLDLLTSYFKVGIGDMLLGHLDKIADRAMLQRASFTLTEQNHQMKLIAAIVNVFHLLPPAAVGFMETLVTRIMNLEGTLRRTRYSPFRDPLIRFLNKYPKDTWSYFSRHLGDLRHGRFFAQILADECSGPLRDAVTQDIAGLFKVAQTVEERDQRFTATVNLVHVLHSIVERTGPAEWIQGPYDTRGGLLRIEKEFQRNMKNDSVPPVLRLCVERAEEQLMQILVVFLASAPHNVDMLFDMIETVTANDLKGVEFFKRYIYDNIVSSDNVDLWRAVVLRCLDLSHGRAVLPQVKRFAFHYLVNPIFAMDIKRSYQQNGSAKGSRFMDKSMTEAIHIKVWKPHLTDFADDHSQHGVDHSRMELLQMSALLVKYHHALFNDVRKDIIKFGWTSIRLEDIINKHAAYVVVAYFIASFESPSKIVIQVYVALLRAYQTEGKTLVAQALDLIASVLPKRVGTAGDSRSLIWAKWPRKILLEDSSNLQQMMSIFHFLVRHPDLFYESREHFVPTIIQSLTKILPTPTPSTESKKLALNVVNLLWQWEQRRVSGAETLPDAPADGTESPVEYTIPANLRAIVVGFLVSLITTLPDRAPAPSQLSKRSEAGQAQPSSPQPPDMIKKSLQLLHDFLSPGYWNDLEFDMLDRLAEVIRGPEPKETKESKEAREAKELKEAKEAKDSNEAKEVKEPKEEGPDRLTTTHLMNALQVLRVMIAFKSNDWILAKLGPITKMLEKPLRSEDPYVQSCIHDDAFLSDATRPPPALLKRVLDALPDEDGEDEEPDSDSTTSEFTTALVNVAGEMMVSLLHVPSINIFWTISRRKPSLLDQQVGSIVKAFSNKISKEPAINTNGGTPPPVPPPQMGRVGETGSNAADLSEEDTKTDLVLKSMEIISRRMSVLAENRRMFLVSLAALVEKANDRVCLKVISMVEGWVFASTDLFPTLKEKTALLNKMLPFESRSDPLLLTSFLDLIIRIYEDPNVTRTELTVRLEHAFLIGTRAQDVKLRNRFMVIFDQSIARSAKARLNYVMSVQSWDTLSDSFWLSQASQLMVGSFKDAQPVQLQAADFTTPPASLMFGSYAQDPRKGDLMLEDNYLDFVGDHKRFCADLGNVKAGDILAPLSQLQHLSPELSHEVWIHIFPLCWASMSKDDRAEMERGTAAMFSKDCHQRQLAERPNVIQTLLEGIAKARPGFKLPPQLWKYLSRTYDAWYTGMAALETDTVSPLVDTTNVRESNMDALIELYAGLQEDDLFYGAWRRRCQYIETNAALSYEQIGMWDKAQQLYEAAQVKARTGTLPLSSGEYMLWEDHWVLCAQKLQQWDILYDFAKHENYNDLLLECAWRQTDLWHGTEQREWLDSIIKGLSDAPTPRRMYLGAFMSLLKLHTKAEALRHAQAPDALAEADAERRQALQEFTRNVDDGMQVVIRKWHQLPSNHVNAHVSLLHTFQELIELHDGNVVGASLAQTTQQNLDGKSQELKVLLASWRDRLPNLWDDINIWQDLVTWRQHVFHLINNTYLNLHPQQGAGQPSNSLAYRGYHETAWIINRFAHVARKHQLPDVCISQLSRIYTLPNIEIQEAFLKLREQAKCHYQSNSELGSGLDVIHNTNLNYFGSNQRAEFFTLKGMFMEKLGQKNEAYEAFGLALSYDLKLPKAWAAWGQYNDNYFKEEPGQFDHAAKAVACYLEASGLYRNAKSRKYLARILWLISLDNEAGTIANAFMDCRVETPVWYWITFIPQLLTSLSHKESKLTKTILMKIAKHFPQVRESHFVGVPSRSMPDADSSRLFTFISGPVART